MQVIFNLNENNGFVAKIINKILTNIYTKFSKTFYPAVNLLHGSSPL